MSGAQLRDVAPLTVRDAGPSLEYIACAFEIQHIESEDGGHGPDNRGEHLSASAAFPRALEGQVSFCVNA